MLFISFITWSQHPIPYHTIARTNMSDPLGAVSGVAGVASLGITACQGLIKYIDSFASANENVRSTIKTAGSLAQLLQQVESYLNHPSLDKATQQSVRRCVLDLEDGVKKLSGKAAKLMDQSTGAGRSRVLAQNIVFPFREHKLEKLRGLCDELKRDLQIALSTLNM